MATPFRPAFDLLALYALYHRDRRNILTHFVGVPLIVFGIGVLLARHSVAVGAFTLTPAWLVWALSTAWYLSRGEFTLGLATSLGIAALLALGEPLARHSLGGWLLWGVGSFAVGWVIQFIGHYYEGKKPAFADDIVGLLVGPMFVVMEMAALLGFFKGLVARIEAQAGPTHVRDLARPAT